MDWYKAILTTFLFCVGIFARSADLQSVQENVQENVHGDLQSPWLWGNNAAALTRFTGSNIGVAELSLTKSKGGFTDFSDSPDALSVDASVESFFRLSRRAVVYGAMSYTNFSGHDMSGSAFIQSQPASSPLLVEHTATSQSSRHLPFDIVEDSLTNTGTKHQDTYRLTGGLGYDLGNGISLGARLGYTAANYAKYKDLRHKNKLMDLDLTAGLYWPVSLSDNMAVCLGANYLYHRTTESLQFSTYGKNDKVYNSLISYANFMGHVEQFGSTGYTDKSREMPLVSDYNGVGVQLHLSPAASHSSPATSHLSLYQSFTYAHRRGYYGRQSPYTITYTGHESDLYSYEAQLSVRSTRGSRFSLDLSLNAENLRNDAANYRELQNEQGATNYEYYTPVKTANKLWTDGTVAFTAELGNSRTCPHLPLWLFRAGLNWHHREQTAYVYPYGRRQDISSKELFLSLSRNLFMHKKSKPDSCQTYFTFALDFSFLKGSGQPYEDMTYQAPSDKQEFPPVMDAWLWREYMWLTAAQFRVGGSVKYSFIMPWTGLRTYMLLSLSHRKANETSEYSLGRNRTAMTFAVGCNF